MRIPFVSKMAVILAVPGLAIAATASPTQAAGTPGWRVVATIAPNNEEVQLNAVTATAPGDAWAVGPTGTGTGNLVEHWNGTAWQQVAVPATVLAKIGGNLSSVSATSTKNVWAFDFNGDWLRFNGSAWTAGQAPELSGGLSLEIAAGIATGTQDAWLFGLDSTTSKVISYAARFNGSSWQAMQLPGPVNQYDVYDASAVSANDIWVIVGGGPGEGTANGLLHWNGTSWKTFALPSSIVNSANLESVLAVPGGDVWVAGGIPGSGGTAEGVTALWNGTGWVVGKLPADRAAPDDVINDLVPDGNAGGAWAMGFNSAGCAGPMWHYASGTWSNIGLVGCSVGAYVHGPQGLANVPGTTSVWAVGGQNDPSVPNGEAGLVMLYGPRP